MRSIFGKKEEWKGKRNGKLITIQIPDELDAELDLIAEKYGIRKSEFIRNAIIEKLMRMEKGNA